MPEDENSIPTFVISDEEFSAAVSPSNVRGRINLRLDQAMQTEIESIADDNRYPLNSVSEVVRYCCLEGLDKLRQWKPGPTLLGVIKSANALLLRDKIQCESIDLLDKLDERVKWYVENRSYDEAIDIVARVRAYFDNMKDEFWAEYMRTEIDQRFLVWMDLIDERRKRS